ncbi:uncharacterized protein [Antedon mediterranea]|uniref:uncharacterized protein n=1 Tax=Antedon mediterranea TaxID=105859 RepID=UPI003AF8C29A
MSVSGRTSELMKHNTTTEDDQSQYHCQYISSSLYANQTVIEKLDVMYPLCETTITSINSDKTVSISCSAKGGNPRPELQWYRNGVKLSKNSGKSTYYDVLKRLLTYEDEQAVFVCKAEGLAVDGKQTCSVNLNVRPEVIITYTTISFEVGDSLEFKCRVMTPWKIIDYVWKTNNTLVTTSGYSFILTDDKTVLIINNLKSSDTDVEIKCQVTTASGLTGSDSVTISLSDRESDWLFVVLFAGGIIFMFIFISVCQKKQEKASVATILETLQTPNQSNADIQNIVSQENPTLTYDQTDDERGSSLVAIINSSSEESSEAETERVTQSPTPSNESTGNQTSDVDEDSSIGSFCSFYSFDDEDTE